ncbi:MAG: hypothetical protein MJ214_02330 [Bacilli bacterium]|nr:hypothetical protein [Bacilli bacterium]
MSTIYNYKYERDFDKDTPKLLEYLSNGGKDKTKIKKMCHHGLSLINQCYDCSDFRIEIFTRILYSYKNVIGREVENLITKTLFRFPFEDQSCHAMCTWTENHQLIIYVSEYLLGNMYPNKKFHDDVLGRDLAKGAYTRLNEWCECVYRFGFSEFGSCNYYPETLGALGNIIEFAKDKKLVEKCKIVLDLLVYDIFSTMTPDLTYNKATARAYVDNKINNYNYSKPHISALLDKTIKVNHEREACFYLMIKANKYKTPKVFLDIFKAKEKELKESNGLNASEYKKNGLLTNKDANARYIMTTGTTESFKRYKNVIKYLGKIKMLDHPTMANNNRPLSYGRGNVYTYVKNNYSVSSLTRYQINEPCFQQVTHIINLDGLGVFTTAPATSMDKTGSPSYWVGSKKNPDCIQHKNILVAYYDRPSLTHIFFPIEKFDEVNLNNLKDGLIFARYHNINLFIRTNEKLKFVDSKKDKAMNEDEKMPNFKLKKYDLVNSNQGDHYYIFEIDDRQPFNEFINNIKKNLPCIDKKHIIYKGLEYSFNKSSYFNHELIQTSYPRFASDFILNKKYTYTKNKPLTFISKNHKLVIDFKNYTRKEN